jgi:hypothetical protein
MSADRDTTRIVRSWLDEGATTLPDRVLDAVLDQVPATPQRRALWPVRRFPPMNNTMKIALAAAVVVVAVIGIGVLLPRDGFGGPGAQPTASPLPSPTASPAAVPSGSMAAGTYLVADSGITLHPYTFTLPAGLSAGWTGGDGASRGEMSGNGVRLTTWIITHVYADSCHWTGTLVPVAETATLVAALTGQVGHTHSTPVVTTIGGLPATKITFTLDAAFDVSTCDIGDAKTGTHIVRLWPDPGPDESGGWTISPGQTTTVYILEANHQLMVLMTVQHKDSPAADVAALQQILDSVEFQP